MHHSLSQQLVARYFAVLLAVSGLVSAVVHPLPNLTDMSGLDRSAITLTCVVGAILVWLAPWNRWPRWALLLLPPLGMGVKLWANLLGGLGPYSYSIHFVLIYVWIGVALPRGAALGFAPLLALAYVLPLYFKGDPRQTASVAMVLPICVLIGESVAWISSRLREVERIDAQHMLRMGWLVRASTNLAHQHQLAELSALVARLATELPGALGAAVLFPGSKRCLEVAASRSWPGVLPERLRIPEAPVLAEAMRRSEALGHEEPGCAALAAQLEVPRLGIAPLPGSHGCMGVVLLARRTASGPLDGFTRNLVETLSLQAGLAIERLRDREQLRDASLHDELTGLGNRRKAQQRMESLAPGDALLLIDLDRFKQVNDSLGHAAGDDLLRQLGAFLPAKLRQGDEAFRLGGEEFLVLLEQAGEGASTAAERLCSGWRLEEPVTTFSAGLCVHRSGSAADDTLARADAALYAAKAAGRDRVREAEDPAAPEPREAEPAGGEGSS